MIFVIERPSLYCDDKKPCDNARKMQVPYWETRTCTEDIFNKRFSRREGLWRHLGSNHKTINAKTNQGSKTWITRKREHKEVWCVEINSLKDLLNLQNNYGELSISDVDFQDGEDKKMKIIQLAG